MFFILLFVLGIVGWIKRKEVFLYLLTVDNVYIKSIVRFLLKDYERMGNCLIIPYGTGKIYVPVSRSHIASTMDYKVIGMKNGNSIDLTQPFGTPYSFTCSDLGLDSIEIRDEENVRIYTGSMSIPIYLV